MQIEDAEMKELLQSVAALKKSVRQLPPGPERHAALKEVGMFQVRTDALRKRLSENHRNN